MQLFRSKRLCFSFSIFVLICIGAGKSAQSNKDRFLSEKTKVSEVLKRLGDEAITHYPNLDIPNVSSIVGENIVLNGFSETQDGKKLPKQSRHFVCTSCHNIVREDPDLSVSDPQARLEYTVAHDIPFLQGTTLYGAVNRTSFYNGDYDKKYGDLVQPARHDIREAIQLCAVECSQGRELRAWELESVLAYLWTIELRLGDLQLSDAEYKQLEAAMRGKADKTENLALLKSKYLQGSPATFVTPPEDRKKGYAETGNPDNGALIYNNSCLHCHENQRYSFFNLDNQPLTLAHLDRHFAQYSPYSVYQVARYGTPPLNGKRAYMPQYTLEKMSNQQLEDLRAYIQQGHQ